MTKDVGISDKGLKGPMVFEYLDLYEITDNVKTQGCKAKKKS